MVEKVSENRLLGKDKCRPWDNILRIEIGFIWLRIEFRDDVL
jgi:hypothetical protein